ncbi:MAG: HEPN domain-containing protein [Paludibacteraceae bacterium]|nr:HEPN domain-containing protein [Paludibacteraceae bacterium]
MSLSNEERHIMVTLELERARKIQSEFSVYQQNELWSTLANRMYYAVYHAAMALLIANGLHAGTHQGVYVLLNQYFIKEKLLSAEHGSLYARLQTMREKGDYNCFIETTSAELLPILPKVSAFIDAIAILVQDI